MNYYQRFLGDYSRDTRHLPLAAHGAYTLLLDTYYATETPLPADLDSLYRICSAINEQDRQAVNVVAEKFFPVADDGLRHNRRADTEIAKARPRIAAARANGMLRGKPLDSQQVPTGLSSGNPEDNQQVASGSTALHQHQHHNSIPNQLGDFVAFWGAYPRKVARLSALKAWKKLKLANGDFDQVMQALEAAKRTEQWRKDSGKFIPHAATWLNGRRFEDEGTTTVGSERPSRICSDCKTKCFTWTGDRCDECWRKYQGLKP